MTTTALNFRPLPVGAAWWQIYRLNWGWLLKRVPMVALALLSSWGVGGFILQSGKTPLPVAVLGSGAFDLVFLGAIALADQGLSSRRSTHYLYWVLNISAAALAALLNTLYYSGGAYTGITAESITHGVPFAVFGLAYSLYYHGVMSEAIEHDEKSAAALAAQRPCPYCSHVAKNTNALYAHWRNCLHYPKKNR